MIMRSVEGYETLDGDQTLRADVHPMPGTEGRIMGDGKITQDDALRILYKAVGLVSEGEITGDYSGSKPRIIDFSPRNGPPGTEVTITGMNFSAALPGENAVYFGETKAALKSATGTRIQATVPAGASSGFIRVKTPGGIAVSGSEFIVTFQSEGKFTPPGSLDPSDFTVVNLYGETTPDPSSGQFFIPLPLDRMALLGAVPKGTGNNSFLALYTPANSGGKTKLTDEPVGIDALSTARTLIFLHPYFLSNDTAPTQYLMTRMESITEVQTLANVIGQRYPQGAEGLEDAEVRNAWAAAVAAVINDLPDGYIVDVSTHLGSSPVKRVTDRNMNDGMTGSVIIGAGNDEVDVHIYAVDQDYIRFRYDDATHSVIPYRSQDYSPVDWLLALYRLDPADMPSGVGENYFELYKRNIRRLRYEKSSMVEANLWTANIDVVGTGLGFVLDGLFDFVGLGGGDEGIPLEDKENGIYMIRAYSGVYKDRWEFLGDDLEGVRNFHRGPELSRYAAGINAVLALVDAWSLVAGEETNFSREAIKAGFQGATAEFSQQVGNNCLGDFSARKALEILLDVIVAAGKGIVEMSAGEGMSQAMEKLQKSCFSALKHATVITAVLEKISTLGKIAERVTGLMGFIINPLGLDIPAGPTPLEVTLVMVGYPFKPIVDSFTPTEGGAGMQITIVGKNFAEVPQKNTVRFGDIDARVVSGEGTEKLVVEVPDGLPVNSTVGIYVKTPADSATVQGFKVTPVPKIDNLNPSVGYGPSANPSGKPYHGFQGTYVSINGEGLKAASGREKHKLYIDSTEVAILSNTSIQMGCYIPALSRGDHDLHIKFQRSDSSWSESNHAKLYVFGPPTIGSVKPASVSVGELIEVRGGGLVESKLVVGGYEATRRMIGDPIDLYSLMPSAGNPGDTLDLEVWNPAGSASAGTIIRNPGIVVPTMTPLPGGFTIPVETTNSGQTPDGEITLDEAAAFARGDLNPFDSYDDRNEKWTHHFYEKENGGGTTWEEHPGELVKETLTENNGPDHETRSHYRIDHYLAGGQSSPYLYLTDDLDDGSSGDRNEEEGDRLSGGGGVTDYLGFDGAGWKDTINTPVTGGTYEAATLLLGNQDTLNMSDTTITVSANLNTPEGATYSFGVLKSSKTIKIEANHVKILGGTIQITGAGAFSVKNAINSSITGVAIESPGGDAVTMNTCGKNTINVTVDNAAGSALVMNECDDNQVTLTASNCTDDGVSMTGCSNNQLGLNIQDCGGYGVLVSGGRVNSLNISEIARCGEGLYYSGTWSNTVSQSSKIHHCTGNGVTIEGGNNNNIGFMRILQNGGHGVDLIDTTACQLGGLHIAGNTGAGIVLKGPDCHHNSINSCQIGRYLAEGSPPGEYTLLGNKSHGIHASGGAHHNDLGGSNMICSNGGSGIFLEGSGTSHNSAPYNVIGLSRTETAFTEGNDGDGIKIGTGASDNEFDNNEIHDNGGNGVSISGSGASENLFSWCQIGTLVLVNGTDRDYRANDGFGVWISDGAAHNNFDHCYIGIHENGGVYVGDLTTEPPTDGVPPLLDSVIIGHELERIVSTFSPGKKGKANSPGYGIQLFDSRYIYLTNTTVQNYDHGLLVTGESSAGHYLEYMKITGGAGYGLYADAGEDIVINGIRTARFDQDGMYIKNNKRLTVMERGTGAYNTSQYNGGAGMVLDTCQDVSIEGMQNSYIHTRGGYRVTGCSNVNFSDCSAYDNESSAFIIEGGSSGVVIDNGNANRSKGAGVEINDSSDVKISGGSGEFGLFNNETGIKVKDSSNVSIGLKGKGRITIVGTSDAGIHITGDKTDNVQVKNCNVMYAVYGGSGGKSALINSTDQSDCILIDGGKNIVIGDENPDFGNYIGENSSLNTGIRAKGNVTNLKILNNVIGKDVLYMTGSSSIIYSTGNHTGIILEEAITGVVVRNNHIVGNASNGLVIRSGAHDNVITTTRISDNGGYGVLVDGAGTRHNQITRNTITHNDSAGISLNGGNDGVPAPVITNVSSSSGKISGVVNPSPPAGSRVEIYSDENDEGRYLLGTTNIYGNNFTLSGVVPPALNPHALIVHPNGNTSSFGPWNQTVPVYRKAFLFASDPALNSDVYIMDPRETFPERLTVHTANDFDPQADSRGNGFLFVSERSGNRDLWFRSFENPENCVQSTIDGSADYEPDWLDGTNLVAFTSERDGNAEIYSTTIITTGSLIGEIQSFSGDLDSWDSETTGNGYAVKLYSGPGDVMKLMYYIAADPAPFDWQLHAIEGSRPGSILVSGTTEPAGTGWHVVDIPRTDAGEEFAVAIIYKEEGRPGIGVASGSGSGYYSYDSDEDEWNGLFGTPLMIKAFVAPRPPTRLTINSAADRGPSWSPDGTRLAFSSDRGGTMDIWIMNADGSDPHVLTDGTGANTLPAWSHDGSRIAFVSDRNGNPDIYTMNADGSGLFRVTDHASDDTDPVWGIGDDMIFFASDREGGFEIFQSKTDGTGQSRLTFQPDGAIQPDVTTDAFFYTLSGEIIEQLQEEPVILQKAPGKDRTGGTGIMLSISDESAGAGEKVDATVDLTSSTEVAFLEMTINYDPTVLEMDSTPSVGIQDGAVYALNPETYPDDSGVLCFSWVKAGGLKGEANVLGLPIRASTYITDAASTVSIVNASACDTGYSSFDVVTRDGIITFKEAVNTLIRDCLLGKKTLTPEQRDLVDLNKDGKIDISDLVYFLIK